MEKMLSLREFVKSSLVEVQEGVREAQEYVRERRNEDDHSWKGAAINLSVTNSKKESVLVAPGLDSAIDTIQFDVAVTLVEGTASGASIGVFSGFVGAGTVA